MTPPRRSGPLVGVIADDATGGTDVAVAFRRHGLTVWLGFRTPEDHDPRTADAAVADVVVLALKIRTIAADRAVAAATTAADWLHQLGAQRLYYKYCSTFDSTATGNIGPVLDALMLQSRTERVVHTPSTPEHGRTQYLGHLFVHHVLLAESPMRDHPLTPMRDSQIVRLLAAQTSADVHLIPHPVISAGRPELQNRLGQLDRGHILVDAITDADLASVGAAISAEPLIAGAAGLAGGLARVLAPAVPPQEDTVVDGPTERAAILAGSCSARTLEEIAVFQRAGLPAHRLDIQRDPDPQAMADRALAWFDTLEPGRVPLVYSSLPPAELSAIHRSIGAEAAAQVFEEAIGAIAKGLANRGVDSFVVAGGETSGAVIEALGCAGGTVGAEAAPGVPWLSAADGKRLLLKSGNFGDVGLLANIGRHGDEAP
ncbi:3-oxo-tetronate kinase [Sphaerimonospora sp. CA-214678]|uniref:3-oxo-tetronate kinase n=1 Tax=Sphaerimonospora sp. CA-214678 TaxID=3240029 RepID=UPI003D8BF49A